MDQPADDAVDVVDAARAFNAERAVASCTSCRADEVRQKHDAFCTRIIDAAPGELAEDARGCSSDAQRNQPGPNAPFVSRLNVTVATARSTDSATDCTYSDVAHTSSTRVGFDVGCVVGCADGTRDG